MRAIKAEVFNFGSYKHLEFNFVPNGLVLISGSTGSGKSTLCDIVPWVLFGKTAKGGAVDDVLNWQAQVPCRGRLTIELAPGEIWTVERARGFKENDLWYSAVESKHPSPPCMRGKDIADTQKRINMLLGFDADLYLSAAYFHEFSQTASFFTTTAKVRRQITEQFADLKMAKTLNASAVDYKKDLKSQLQEETQDANRIGTTKGYLEASALKEQALEQNWSVSTTERLARLTKASENFEVDKARSLKKLKTDHEEALGRLTSEAKSLELEVRSAPRREEELQALQRQLASFPVEKCPTCGSLKDQTQRLLLERQIYKLEKAVESQALLEHRYQRDLRAIASLVSNYNIAYSKEQARENTYFTEIAIVKAESNPHTPELKDIRAKIKGVKEALRATQEAITLSYQHLQDTELLLKITDEFRGVVIQTSVTQLQNATNKLLNDHFDAEIRVLFSAEDADKLEVDIVKEGHHAVYTQLSKGQRQLVKLAFGVSVMRMVANHNGLRFSSLFLDEALDGLDEAMKVRALGLLETLSLEFDTVFLVEHSPSVKAMVNSIIDVRLVNGESIIEEA